MLPSFIFRFIHYAHGCRCMAGIGGMLRWPEGYCGHFSSSQKPLRQVREPGSGSLQAQRSANVRSGRMSF